VLVATGVLTVAPVRAASQFMGIEPGVSTRAQVARVLGRDVKITDTLSEYAVTSIANVSRVLVQYRPGDDIVDRMEVYFTTVQSRDFVVKALTLGRPTSSAATPRFREFHGAPLLLALNYAGGAAESGVVSVGYYSVEAFADVIARSGASTTSVAGTGTAVGVSPVARAPALPAPSVTPSTPRPTTAPATSRPVPIGDLASPRFTGSILDSVPLRLYWKASRGDNFTSATAEGDEAARIAGYQPVRVEGYIFPKQLPGTVPLKMYYHDKRGDSFTTATPEGEQTAEREGYRFGRIEGYVLPTQVANSAPLKQFWSAARQDYFVTATAAGESDARRAGYVFVRIEGWVLDAVPVP
jgi:hypothetical protein